MGAEWLTAAELAGLPGVPGTDRGIRKAADRAGWTARKRDQGKGYLYLLDSLPAETQEAVRRQRAAEHLADFAAQAVARDRTIPEAAVSDHAERLREQEAERRRRKVAAAAQFAALDPTSDRARRAKAREWLILAAGELRRVQALTQQAALAELCERINLGDLAVPDHVAPYLPRRHGVRSLSAATLYTWQRKYEEGGLYALCDGYGNRAGQNSIDTTPELRRVVLGQMLATPQASAKDLYAILRARAAELTAAGAEIPALRTVQRYRERWIEDNRQLWAYITSPGKWKNHFQVAFGSHQDRIKRLNQVWELDSTPGDWLLTDGRHSVVGAIDLYSRRLTLYVSRTSSAMAVGQCFRRAAVAWGVPEICRTDNGKDYVSDYFSTVLRDLEITQELCIPFASEQKGTIERALKTMAYGVLKLLPGYCGHNVAEQQQIRERRTFAERVMTPGEVVEVAMSAADLQAALNDWLEHHYHQAAHSGEGMDGISPAQKAAGWTGPTRHVDERALDALLAPIAGERVVGKKGITWQHRRYISPILAEYVGETVRCRYDEQDLGRLYVYSSDAFLCVAQNPEMAGISKAAVAAAAHAKQRAKLAEHAAELKALKQAAQANAAQEVLMHQAQQAGKLVQFPGPKTAHTTPALAAGAAAAQAAAGPAPAHDTEASLAAKQALVAKAAGNVHALPQGPADRFRRWLLLDRAIRDGLGADDPAELDWWESYATTPEYRAQQKLAAQFPAAYGLEVDTDG